MRILIFLFILCGYLLCQAKAAVAPPIGMFINEAEFASWQKEFENRKLVLEQLMKDAGLKYSHSNYLNRLIFEASPYLLRHATNPIDWQSWQDSVLGQAEKDNKLIFLSIGYSTCHWCHVMEKESFIDLEVAKVLNTSFTSIKIDRELKPDIDQYFTNALELITGSAGWPITAILTPEGKPVWLGSYIEKNKLIKILNRLNTVWQKSPDRINQVAKNIALQLNVESVDNAVKWRKDLPDNLVLKQINELDNEHGGLPGAPKFPNATLLQLLIYQYQLSPEQSLKQQITLNLNNVLKKGLRDHLNGGFYRYSIYDTWMQPHFEKMLYNQALLISVYSKAYSVFKNENYKNAAIDTINFVENSLKDSQGGFHSAIDADYNGKEGRYYVFSETELAAVSPAVIAHYDWYQYKGSNLKVPYNPKGDWVAAKSELLQVKSDLVKPHIDKKVITAWNALMVTAYIDAYVNLDERKFLHSAIQLANYLVNNHHLEVGGLSRARFGGKFSGKATLNDYAYISSALLDLYLVTSDKLWLKASVNYYREGSTLYAKDYKGEEITLNTQINDGELISGHVILVATGARLNELGEKVYQQLKPQLNKLKTAISEPSSNSFSAIEFLLKQNHGDFKIIKHFAKGKGKVSYKLVNDEIILNIHMDEGWHINSDKPNQKFLISTALKSRTGVLLNISYPPAVEKKLGFNQSILSLFEGSFKIKSKLGERSVFGETFELRLQACSDKVCLLPETLKFHIAGK